MAKLKTNDRVKTWLKEELLPYRSFVILIAILNIVISIFSLAFAYLVRYLINSATQNDKKLLLIFAAVLFIIIILRILLQTSATYLAERCRTKITIGIRQKVFTKILYSDYQYIEKYHSGDFLNRLTSDVGEVANNTVSILPATLGMLMQGIGALTALMTLDWVFTLLFVAAAAVIGVMTALLRKKSKLYHKQTIKADGESRSFIQESIASALTLKAYSAEDSISSQSKNILNDYYEKRMQKNKLRTFIGGTFSLLSNAGFIFALIWCGIGIMQGRIDYGAMLSVILLLGQLRHPLTSFSAIMPLYYARHASAERLYEIYLLPKELLEKKEMNLCYDDMKSIKIENITFNYDKKNVFTNAFAEINKGNIICVTGDSASGKSTLFKLLLNVYKPNEGEILIEDKKGNLSPLTASDRILFAYVPQGNFLFSGTVKDNLISFSTETSSKVLQQKIDTALSVACAEFVYNLPNGLDTYLWERGGGLSEGQLQRLAIARSLISDRPILLLDEATSALDEETEKNLLKNLKQIQGRTFLIVTHRPAAIKIADRILHIYQGKITDNIIDF